METLNWGVELTEGPAARQGYPDCRVVRTARTPQAINAAVDAGFFPLVKAVEPDPNIRQVITIFQDPVTGKIALSGSRRDGLGEKEVILVRDYYPYSFPSPYAAYLIPDDIKQGETVWIADLIEDLVASWGNDGDQPRLACGPAIWNGNSFEMIFNPSQDAEQWIG